MNERIKACLFDVFGTVVDWRGSIARDAVGDDSLQVEELRPAHAEQSLEVERKLELRVAAA